MFYKMNSIILLPPIDSHSNDCIKQYNHFYGLIEEMYPKKTDMQKVHLALHMIRICQDKKIMNMYLKDNFKKKKIKKKVSFLKKLKKFLSKATYG